jgi:hypothetical protein
MPAKAKRRARMGRPPKPAGTTLGAVLLVRLRAEDHAALQRWAEEQDSTPATLVRGLIERALRRRDERSP